MGVIGMYVVEVGFKFIMWMIWKVKFLLILYVLIIIKGRKVGIFYVWEVKKMYWIINSVYNISIYKIKVFLVFWLCLLLF